MVREPRGEQNRQVLHSSVLHEIAFGVQYLAGIHWQNQNDLRLSEHENKSPIKYFKRNTAAFQGINALADKLVDKIDLWVC